MKCQYKSTKCGGAEISKFEAELKGSITWSGKCCKKCLIAMQRIVYRNNNGVLKFRELINDKWQQYGTDF